MCNVTFELYKYFVHFSGRRLFAYDIEKTDLRSVMKWQFWPIRSFHCMLCCSDSESKWWKHVSSWITFELWNNFCWVTSALFENFSRNSRAVLVLAFSAPSDRHRVHMLKLIFTAQKSYCACRVLSIATIRSKYDFNFILNKTRSSRELFDRPS